VVEYLFSKHKALSSTPSTIKRRKKNKKKERKEGRKENYRPSLSPEPLTPLLGPPSLTPE
jgi:ribosomal protein L9